MTGLEQYTFRGRLVIRVQSSMSGDEEIKRIGAILNQIMTSGIEEESLPGLMEKFERGITCTGIQRPCTIGD